MMAHAKVPRIMANTAIEWIRSLDLLDDDYRIQNLGDDVLIPLKRDTLPENSLPVTIEMAEPRTNRRKIQPVSARGSFDHLGSIAIVKIRDEKRALEVAGSIMTANRGIRSVFLDMGITGEERRRNLRLIAGEENYVVVHRENSLRFTFDIREVYFSPRLATERLLVAKRCSTRDRVLDMFSGIGPFAITIARLAGSSVRCFDVNSASIRWLEENARINGVDSMIRSSAGDAADLIHKEGNFDRIIMNLPHSSFKYLESAREHLEENGIINYYEICGYEDLERRMEMIRDMGLQISGKRIVHGYAPGIFMHSLELTVPG